MTPERKFAIEAAYKTVKWQDDETCGDDPTTGTLHLSVPDGVNGFDAAEIAANLLGVDEFLVTHKLSAHRLIISKLPPTTRRAFR